jgi:hypothetical protein
MRGIACLNAAEGTQTDSKMNSTRLQPRSYKVVCMDDEASAWLQWVLLLTPADPSERNMSI